VIALDTNVLVRFLVRDDAAQHRKAVHLIGRASREEIPLLVTDVVLCELIWVLSYSYQVDRPALIAILRDLLSARQILIVSRDTVARAVDAYAAGRGDFADYVIREQARAMGSESVATFDRALLKEDGFSQP
jgi:predicted nucleic-acid-binding protein